LRAAPPLSRAARRPAAQAGPSPTIPPSHVPAPIRLRASLLGLACLVLAGLGLAGLVWVGGAEPLHAQTAKQRQPCADPRPGDNLTRCSFTDAKLPGRDLSRTDLRGVGFQHADLTGARLDDVLAARANFGAARLAGATLHGDFEAAQFRNAVLTQVEAIGAVFTGADFSQAHLE
jgi:uncharacterized protein YjbI with pentapeptide repeats